MRLSRSSGCCIGIVVVAALLGGCNPIVDPGPGDSGGTGTPASSVVPACSAPAQDPYVPATIDASYTAIEGDWKLCQWISGAPADAVGIRFSPGSLVPTAKGSTEGGDAFYLVEGADGPVPGVGFAYTLTYDVSDLGVGSFQLNIHPMPNSGFGGTFRASNNPRQLEIDTDFDPWQLLVVE